MDAWLRVLSLVFLVAANGYFVAVEYALVSVRHTRIDQLVEEGNAAARLVQRVLGKLDLYIAAVQLGVSMMSLLIGFIAEPAIEVLVGPVFQRLGVPENWQHYLSFFVAFALSTTLHIVFGELFPKSAALQRSEQLAMRLVRPLVVFTAIFRPIILGLNGLGGLALRAFGFKAVAGHHTAHSEEEIRMIVSASSQEGVLENAEKELLYNVFDLSDTVVRSVMTPRVEMVVTDSAAPLRRLLELNAEHGYSRVPVYQDTPDNVVGVAHTSDVLRHLEHLDQMSIAEMMRPTFYIPESMRINDLLKKMQERKSHMAIVVDEFGGTSGVVTLEDALEEIVGEIYDEDDEVEAEAVQVLGENLYLIDASLERDEVEARLGITLDDQEEGEFDTLAGFITHRFGDIPAVGESFIQDGWSFTVEEADQRRVLKVRAERLPLPVLSAAEEAARD